MNLFDTLDQYEAAKSMFFMKLRRSECSERCEIDPPPVLSELGHPRAEAVRAAHVLECVGPLACQNPPSPRILGKRLGLLTCSTAQASHIPGFPKSFICHSGSTHSDAGAARATQSPKRLRPLLIRTLRVAPISGGF